MKHFILVLLILLTSCIPQRQVIYRNCNCITSNNVYTNPYWNWDSYDSFLNFNRWSWYSYNNIPRYYVPNQSFRQQVPFNYNRRRSTQPQQNVSPNKTRTRRTPVYRNNTQYNRNRLQNNRRPSYNVPITTPRRNSTPIYLKPSQSVPNRTNQNRTITPSKPILVPSRGGHRN